MPSREECNSNYAVAQRRRIQLTETIPVHLDQVGPWFNVKVPPHTVPPPRGGSGPSEAGQLGDGGVQTVATEHPVGANSGRLNEALALAEVRDLRLHNASADLEGSLAQGGVQRRAANSEPRAALEEMVGVTLAVAVAHSAQGVTTDRDTEAIEQRHSARHEAFAARLVNRLPSLLNDCRLKPREPSFDRGCEANWAATDNENRGHAASRLRAPFSIGILKRNRRTALSTVNTMAVIHEVCTSGSATPSMATIT